MGGLPGGYIGIEVGAPHAGYALEGVLGLAVSVVTVPYDSGGLICQLYINHRDHIRILSGCDNPSRQDLLDRIRILGVRNQGMDTTAARLMRC